MEARLLFAVLAGAGAGAAAANPTWPSRCQTLVATDTDPAMKWFCQGGGHPEPDPKKWGFRTCTNTHFACTPPQTQQAQPERRHDVGPPLSTPPPPPPPPPRRRLSCRPTVPPFPAPRRPPSRLAPPPLPTTRLTRPSAALQAVLEQLRPRRHLLSAFPQQPCRSCVRSNLLQRLPPQHPQPPQWTW